MKKYGRVTERLTREVLEDLYLLKKKSLQDIANEFSCTRPMIQIIMQRHGIQRRKRSEARVLAIKNKKFERFEHDDINEDFFSQWSDGMAWILGLLFTDGNVQRTTKTGTGLRISITSIDIDLLEKVRNLLGSKRPIYKGAQSYDKSRFIYRFEFYREKMRNDLHRLGLIERKSLNMQFPDIPDHYMRHFIRGCWDGDGTVYISNGKLNASYVTGSKDFIERLVMELYKAGIYRRILAQNTKNGRKYWSEFPLGEYPLAIYKEKRSNAYTIKLNSRDNLEKFFHYLYNGVDETMYLNRKYEVFLKGLFLNEEDIGKQREGKYEKPIYTIETHKHKPLHAIRRRILTVNNSDGKLKCFNCGNVDEKMYITSKTYCPKCITGIG